MNNGIDNLTSAFAALGVDETTKALVRKRLEPMINLSASELDLCSPFGGPYRSICREDLTPYSIQFYPYGESGEGDALGTSVHKHINSHLAEEIHSHPWEWIASLILAGSYGEDRAYGPQLDITTLARTEFKRGDVNVIRWYDFHRLRLIEKPTWTFFVHGPRVRDWSFADIQTGALRSRIRDAVPNLLPAA